MVGRSLPCKTCMGADHAESGSGWAYRSRFYELNLLPSIPAHYSGIVQHKPLFLSRFCGPERHLLWTTEMPFIVNRGTTLIIERE